MTRADSRGRLVAAALLVGSTSVAAQLGVGPAAPMGPGTGLIVGQVVDGTTGRPVPEAVVRLSMPRLAPDSPTGPSGRVIVDADGRFFFADLPEGEYWLEARVDGYSTGAFGQRRVNGDAERLSLHEGERRADVTIRVWKYAVMAGRVLDEAGEPVVGVSVRALVRNIVAGRPQYGSESYLVPSTVTDDRGMFRLARVPPGTYALVVPSVQTTIPASVMNASDASALRTELFWAGIRETTPLGNPRTQQIGDHVLMTLNAVQVPPPPTTDGRLSTYQTTFYPSASSASAATAISVGAGEERADLDFTLRPTSAVRVSGRVVAPDGTAPPPTTIKLIGAARADVTSASRPNGPAEVGFDTAVSMSDASGAFMFMGVPPGEYVMTHADGFLSRLAREGRPTYWVNQRIAVGTDDVSDLAVALRPALRVEGRIAIRRAAGSREPEVNPIAILVFERASGDPDQFALSVEGDQFATVAGGGRYIIRASAFNGWFVESITLDGKSITERPFDLDGDVTSIVITYTNQPLKVSGNVKDSAGSPAFDAMVVVFPTDPQRWSDYGKSPRAVVSADVSATGTYTFNHLVPGQYFIAALDAAAIDRWRDPEVLQSLSSRAERLTIAAGDAARTLDLTLRAVR